MMAAVFTYDELLAKAKEIFSNNELPGNVKHIAFKNHFGEMTFPVPALESNDVDEYDPS